MVENKKVIGVAVTERVNEAMLLTKKALSNTSSNQVSSPSSSSSISPMENKAIEDVASALSSGVNIEDARVSDTTVKVSLGVAQIWVHDDHRRRGIATRLLDMARASVIFAYEVQKSDVAFSMPTSGGLALARAYLATDQIPIYF
jgi:N-acetyltransferase